MKSFQFNDSWEEGVYQFGDKIDNEELSDSLEYPSVVSYRYLELEPVTKYHFSQSCLDNKDIIGYFKFMKLLTSVPFNLLRESKKHEWHLNPTYYHTQKSFRLLVNQSLGLKKDLPIESTPNFFHFALGTSGKASRETGEKSPRIYFFFGNNATIYPLFYDPFHEINP